MKAVLFDLGGTLWAPFGGLTKEEVVESAARNAALGLIDDLFEGLCAGDAVRLRREFGSSLVRSMSDAVRGRDEALRRGDFSHPSFAEVSVGVLVRDAIRHVFGKEVRDPVLEGEFGRDLCRHSTPYPESEAVLAQVKADLPDIRVGIVSNTAVQPHVIDEFLRECRLDPYIDFRVYSSSVGWRKPHPAIYEAALAEAGAIPQEVVFVGDSVFEDVRAPKRMGMKAIFCQRRRLTEDPCADAVVTDLTPVPILLKRFTLSW